jgi:hypothetical protein
LIDGSKAACRAVDEFEHHGVTEFSIGKTVFSGRNESVMRGYILSQHLREHCRMLGLDELLEREYSVRELTNELMRRIRDVRTVDRSADSEE